ncbi:MAG: hypothetical protein ACI4R9_03960 [Kiritimatiellia bacterium]
MKNELVHFAFAALVLVFGGAVEELLPKALGAGFPVLLSAALVMTARRGAVEALVFAVAAGALEDALSGLPAATSIGFFTLAALVGRIPWAVPPGMVVVFPLYQLWLWIWMPSLNGSIFSRLLLAFPFGGAALVGTAAVMIWLERKAVLDAK